MLLADKVLKLLGKENAKEKYKVSYMSWGIVGYSLRLTVVMITPETVTGLYFFFLSS